MWGSGTLSCWEIGVHLRGHMSMQLTPWVTGITEPMEQGKAKNRVLASTNLERSTKRKEDPRRRHSDFANRRRC